MSILSAIYRSIVLIHYPVIIIIAVLVLMAIALQSFAHVPVNELGGKTDRIRGDGMEPVFKAGMLIGALRIVHVIIDIAEALLKLVDSYDGALPFTDKAT